MTNQNTVDQQQFPITVEQFKKLGQIQNPFLQFPIPFKIKNQNYLLYRQKGWQKHKKLKTIIFIPGTAFVYFNHIGADVIFPGMLLDLQQNVQLLVPIYPNAPQNKFPIQLNFLKDFIQNVMKDYQKYLIDKQNIMIGNYSCGGSLTVPLAIYLSKKNIFFKHFMFISPNFDYSHILNKDRKLSQKWGHYQKKDHKMLNHNFINFMNQINGLSGPQLQDPNYSSIFTPVYQLKIFNKCSFIYGQYDFMRRTIQVFKQKIQQSTKIKPNSYIIENEGHRTMVMTYKKTEIFQKSKFEAIKNQKYQNLKIIRQCIKLIFKK